MGDILDVGVQTSTLELLEAFPDRRHILMEPLVEFNDRIKHAYSSASIDFEIINAAIGEADGETLLKLLSVLPGEEVSHAQMIDQADEKERVRTVEKLTLDTITASRDLKEPYLLKIDIDGAELSVLAGATETLKRTGFVVIEVTFANIFERADVLRKAGFQFFDIVDICYYNDRFYQADLVFISIKMVRDYGLELIKGRFDVSNWKAYRC